MTYIGRIIPAISPNAWSEQTGPENWQRWPGRTRLLNKGYTTEDPLVPAKAPGLTSLHQQHRWGTWPRPRRWGTAKTTLLGAHRQQLEIFTAKFWERNGNATAIAGPRVEMQDAKQVRVAILDKVPHVGWVGEWAAGCGQPTVWVNEKAQGLWDCMTAGTCTWGREAGTWHFSNGLWPEEFEEMAKMVEEVNSRHISKVWLFLALTTFSSSSSLPKFQFAFSTASTLVVADTKGNVLVVLERKA